MSTFPEEIIKDMLNSLHVETPKNHIKLTNNVLPFVESPAGRHSCRIGTPNISEFLINWTDDKNYAKFDKDVSDGTLTIGRSSESWPMTTFYLGTYTNGTDKNSTLNFEIWWYPNKRETSTVQDLEVESEGLAIRSDITIQGKKALLAKYKERKLYQGAEIPPTIIPASFFVCYYIDDYTYVKIYAPASEWNDSDFKNTMSSLKITPPTGYY
jgi:hypothetical protein